MGAVKQFFDVLNLYKGEHGECESLDASNSNLHTVSV